MFAELERFVRRQIERWRIGWYRAKVSGAPRSHRRADIDPDWGATLRAALRISSPILDVLYAAGVPVAVLSRDGIPERPAILGQLWDDTTPVEAMTVWLRADLANEPGHVELGATQSLQLYVGPNPGEITPLEPGKIRIGNATVDLVTLLDQLLDALSKVRVQTSLGPQPLLDTPTVGSMTASLADIREQLLEILVT